MSQQNNEPGFSLGPHFDLMVAASTIHSGLRPGAPLRHWWERVDPTLRTCWVQRWVLAPGVSERYFLPGDDPRPLVDQLIVDEPMVARWSAFEKHLTGLLRDSLPAKLSSWVPGEPESAGPDLMLLPLREPSRVGMTGDALPLLLRDSPSCGWRLLNFGMASPRAGWPPIF
jgi:hypothetical protein